MLTPGARSVVESEQRVRSVRGPRIADRSVPLPTLP
jgi:hypothetical protein